VQTLRWRGMDSNVQFRASFDKLIDDPYWIDATARSDLIHSHVRLSKVSKRRTVFELHPSATGVLWLTTAFGVLGCEALDML
jgi:hypothetical protein